MKRQLFIGSAFVARYPHGGGNHWVPLQYLLGFTALGVDAYWLEVLQTTGQPETDREFIDEFLRKGRRLDPANRTVLLFFPSGYDHPADRVVYGMPAAEFDARTRDGMLLNLGGGVQPRQRESFARTVLFDIDPGPFQIWAAQWDMGVGSHDVHLTIGRNLGGADSPVPLGNVDWKKTWPVVFLPAWPRQHGPAGAYTTVTHWWSEEAAYVGDDCFDCNKRNGFVPFADLPRHTSARLELAASIHASERDDIDLFTSNGWHLVDPGSVAGTPERFRDYVRQSRGEFSCAKPAYVKARSGWISDRSVCYLASGRPCILEDTGAAALLPETNGLRTFTNVREAAEALATTESCYQAASADARSLAEEVFSTHVTLPRLMNLCGF